MLLSQIPEALAEEMARMVQACAVVDLATGAGTWATVALGQGLPYFGVAPAGMQYHEVMGQPRWGRRVVPENVVVFFAWVSELESI